MRYPGGKNAAGTYHKIINLIPPHSLYVEPFLGSAAILRYKRPAARSVGIDLDPGAIAVLDGEVLRSVTCRSMTCRLVIGDGIEWLKRLGPKLPTDAFIYCDPPYLLTSRSSGPMYRHELSYRDHARLLCVLRKLPCQVMISGYASALYGVRLADWHATSFEVVTRGGTMATEWLWMNYPAPHELHDYRYVGRDYREREKFVRQQRRWQARLGRMTPLQRLALMAAIGNAESQGSQPKREP